MINSVSSPAQTKFLPCSDEEIIRNVDQRRTYRQGWPRLPPLPVRYIREGAEAAFHVNGTKEIFDKLFDKVWEIWFDEGLGLATSHLAFRPPIAEQPTDTDADTYLTVMIFASHHPVSNPRNAIFRLRKFMQHHVGTRGLYIEYLIGLPHDNGLTHSLALHRQADAYYLQHYDEIYNTALSEIRKFGEQWIMLSLSRRGLNNVSSTVPTLVIETPTANNLAWDEIVRNLRKMWKNSMPKLEIEVYCRTSQWKEILCRDPEPKKNEDMARPHIGLFPDDFSSRMTMGSSIGREGTDHSGTAGGMVKLDNGMCYALSNHHVVGLDEAEIGDAGLQTGTLLNLSSDIQADPHDAEMTKPARIHKHTSPYLRKPGARVLNRVASPSDQDKTLFEEEHNLIVAWAENKLWDIEHSLFSMRFQTKLRMSLPHLRFKEEALSKLAKLMAFNPKRHLGTVYASSGFRTARFKRVCIDTEVPQIVFILGVPQTFAQ